MRKLKDKQKSYTTSQLMKRQIRQLTLSGYESTKKRIYPKYVLNYC